MSTATSPDPCPSIDGQTLLSIKRSIPSDDYSLLVAAIILPKRKQLQYVSVLSGEMLCILKPMCMCMCMCMCVSVMCARSTSTKVPCISDCSFPCFPHGRVRMYNCAPAIRHALYCLALTCPERGGESSRSRRETENTQEIRPRQSKAVTCRE